MARAVNSGRFLRVTAALALALALRAEAQKRSITFGSTNAPCSNHALAVAMSKAVKKELLNACD